MICCIHSKNSNNKINADQTAPSQEQSEYQSDLVIHFVQAICQKNKEFKLEPNHEKTLFFGMQRKDNQRHSNCAVDLGLCFHFIDSTVPPNSKYRFLQKFKIKVP